MKVTEQVSNELFQKHTNANATLSLPIFLLIWLKNKGDITIQSGVYPTCGLFLTIKR
jgi:hypothetical protein